jgi:hypothetical protein
MKTLGLSLLFVGAAGLASAQQWEFGGMAGAGFLSHVGVSNAAGGSATAGFKTGIVAGAFLEYNSSKHISGELRYGFMQSDMYIHSGGSEAGFSGQSHVLHYDLVLHTPGADARRQFFVAAGGGMRIFRGTGQESAYQPLSEWGYLTKTQVVKPMVSVGAGVKYRIKPGVYLRAEVRDYITSFPSELIAPAPGTSYGSILHDIVPTIGISFQR